MVPNRDEAPFPQISCISFGLPTCSVCRSGGERSRIMSERFTHHEESHRLIRLTTVLARSSGEWVSSDWPVCRVSETVAPHRTGATLTYARRYALLTLSGLPARPILMAPDLGASPEAGADQPPGPVGQKPNGHALQPAGSHQRVPEAGSPSTAQLLSPSWQPISRRHCGISWLPNSAAFIPPRRQPVGPIGLCRRRTP
jgi:hypothetical protein